jgi:DNA-binding CsgD family transcriptional regulator
LVVLVSRSVEERRSASLERGRSLRARFEAQAISDAVSRQQGSEPGTRDVVCCICISGSSADTLAKLAEITSKRLSVLIRLNDQICTIGDGRVVVMFKDVHPSLDAQVLGSRLARTALEALAETGASVVVGTADGEPGSDLIELTEAAISSAEEHSYVNGSQNAFVVLTSLRGRNGTPRLLEPLTPSDGSAAAQGAAFVIVDSAPSSSGSPGVAAMAVTSLVEATGFNVIGTIAPHLERETGNVARLQQVEVPGAIALLVVHPGNGTDVESEHGTVLEKPAAVTDTLRRAGVRVFAVGVGVSDIALAECLVHGAERAFGIGELPDGMAQAMLAKKGDEESDDAGSANNENHGQRSVRLAKLLLLTRSERRVLYHLTTGATAIEIAEKLVLSLATVRSHIRSILRKLEVSSQLAAVAIAQGHPVRPSESDNERV